MYWWIYCKNSDLKIYDITFPEDIKYGEDQIFILKSIIHSEKIKVINEPICLYRTNLSSAMYRITLRRFDVVIAFACSRQISLQNRLPFIKNDLYEIRFARPLGNHNWSIQIWDGHKNGKKIFRIKSRNTRLPIRPIAQQKNKQSRETSNHLYRLKAEVLFDKYIYMFRCNASKIKKN